MYNIIFGRRKTFQVNSPEITYKVHYLGNVMTSHLKGSYVTNESNSSYLDQILNYEEDENESDDESSKIKKNQKQHELFLSSIDKPVQILWDNHLKHNGQAGIKMKLTLTQGGLRVDTKDHGLTEYFGHRIYLIKAHSLHPKLLVWVYQHVGKNLKSEIRCHAALCQTSKHSKTIELLLNEKLKQTFHEYKREKKRLQNSRLCNSKNGGLLANQLGNKKRTFRTITHNYKPPVQHGMCSAPKLDDVIEEDELEEVEDKNEKEIFQKTLNVQEEYLNKSFSSSCSSFGRDEDEIENYYYQEPELDVTETTVSSLNSQYDNRPLTQQFNLSTSSSSSVSTTSSPSLTQKQNLFTEQLPAYNTTIKSDIFSEISYDFLSDLSKSIEKNNKKELKHSKSFKQYNDNYNLNQFKRNTNFSKSFNVFSNRKKQDEIGLIQGLKELSLNESNNETGTNSSLSSPALSTCSSGSACSAVSNHNIVMSM